MRSRNQKVAVLASGGLDSAILLDHCLRKFQSVQPLYVESGYRWERVEINSLKRFLKTVRDKRLKPLVRFKVSLGALMEGHWSVTGKQVPGARSRDEAVYLPGKNILLTACGSVFCALNGIAHLALGPLKTNPFPDASPGFFKTMARACSQGLGQSVQLVTPFLTCTKTDVMNMGRRLALELTFSCLNPRRRLHCGRCNKCAERRKAFRNAGIVDRTRYAR